MITEKELRKEILLGLENTNLNLNNFDTDTREILVNLIHIATLESILNNGIDTFYEFIKSHSIDYLKYFEFILINEMNNHKQPRIIKNEKIIIPKMIELIQKEIEIKME